LIDVQVEEVLKGDLPHGVITLKEEGGVVAGRRTVIFGMPEYRVGEQVLVFVSAHADGSLRTHHLALGKFSLAPDAAGVVQADRRFGIHATVLVPPGSAPVRRRVSLSELRTAIARGRAASLEPRAASALRAEPLEASDPSLRREAATALADDVRARFFEVDEGVALTFLLDQTHDSFLGVAAARQAWEAAMEAWTAVPAAAITLRGGGARVASIWDPRVAGFMPGEKNRACGGGIGGFGGWTALNAEVKTFHGTAFARITGAFARVYTKAGCPEYAHCNVAEVATHELGHAIGLVHSLDPDATMSGGSAFDCRCAGLRGDDAEAVSFVYPTAIPPTITTAAVLPDGTVGMSYRQAFAAMGGAGTFTWSFAEDGSNPGEDDFGEGTPGLPSYDPDDGLSLSADGVLSGIPTWTEERSALIRATDANGDSHTKRFALTVRPPDAPPTTTSTTTTTTTTATGETNPIECVLPTTTTVPPWCDAAPTFVGIYCKLGEAKRLVDTFAHRRGRARRLLSRLDAATSAANAAAYPAQAKYRQARRLLERAERHGRALWKLARRPGFIDAVGAPQAAALEALAEALVARVVATRDDLPRRPCLRPTGGACRTNAECPKGTECAADSGRSE
jgi:hypothetical protein